MAADLKGTWPAYLVLITMKSGEEDAAEANSEQEYEVLLAEVMSDKDVANWCAYKQIKSAYPAQS